MSGKMTIYKPATVKGLILHIECVLYVQHVEYVEKIEMQRR